jgi:putative membrane protein
MLWMGVGVLFWIGALALIIWAVSRLFVNRNTYQQGAPPMTPTSGPTALEILQQRFARGEIDAPTYEQMRERISGGGPTATT